MTSISWLIVVITIGPGVGSVTNSAVTYTKFYVPHPHGKQCTYGASLGWRKNTTVDTCARKCSNIATCTGFNMVTGGAECELRQGMCWDDADMIQNVTVTYYHSKRLCYRSFVKITAVGAKVISSNCTFLWMKYGSVDDCMKEACAHGGPGNVDGFSFYTLSTPTRCIARDCPHKGVYVNTPLAGYELYTRIGHQTVTLN